MIRLELKNFSNGMVTYLPPRDAKPEHISKADNENLRVEVAAAGTDELPALFEVSFPIGFTVGEDRGGLHHYLELRIQVATKNSDRSYLEVEDSAARQVPHVLRALADAVDKEIARYDLGDQEASQ